MPTGGDGSQQHTCVFVDTISVRDAQGAVREAVNKAKPVVLEPVRCEREADDAS